MRQIAGFVAVLSCALFTGASIYISLVEHPAQNIPFTLPSQKYISTIPHSQAADGDMAAVVSPDKDHLWKERRIFLNVPISQLQCPAK